MSQEIPKIVPSQPPENQYRFYIAQPPPPRRLSFARWPRYAMVLLLALLAIWVPIFVYLKTSPLKFTSEMSLILPGSGASASINLNEIGQASSFANSAFSNGSVSPTETYKRLLGANRILNAAAARVQVPTSDFGAPRIDLIDQTALIQVEMTGNTPKEARERNTALLDAFFSELEKLRANELTTREDGGQAALRDYHESVRSTREAITELQKQTGLNSAAQYKAQVDSADALRAKVDQLAADFENAKGAVQQLEERLGTSPAQAGLTLRLYADITFMALEREMAEQVATLVDARSRYGDAHPITAKARAARDVARAQSLVRAQQVTGLDIEELQKLDFAPDGARADLLAELVRRETERSGLQTQLQEMRAQLAAETTRLAFLAPAATQLEDTQRDFNVAEAVFASAIARTQTSKTDIYASYPLVQVLEDPSLPDEPSSPKRMLALAAGALASVMLMIGLALGWSRQKILTRILTQPTPVT